MSPADRLAAVFGFALFSRLQARRAGLEADLFAAEAAGRARFVRYAGGAPDMGGWNEMFRVLA